MCELMVHRVARAICFTLDGDPDATTGIRLKTGIWTEDGVLHWTGYVEIACAAIAAMRLPSDEDFGGKYGTEPRRLFSEMIDTALSEHKTQTRKG